MLKKKYIYIYDCELVFYEFYYLPFQSHTLYLTMFYICLLNVYSFRLLWFFFFWLEINSIFVCWFLVSYTNPVKTIYIYFWFLKWNSCLSCILLNLLFLYCSCPRDTYTRCQINTRYFDNCLKWKQEESVI